MSSHTIACERLRRLQKGGSVRIELLYFADCPNWRNCFDELYTMLRERAVSDDVELIEVESNEEANRLEFLGSPTIRVDGIDIELDIPSSGYNMENRVYWVDERATGRPPKEWIAAAIDAALE